MTAAKPAVPEVLVVAKGGRDLRLEKLAKGEEAPREFFYGYFDLEKAGISAAMVSSAERISGPRGRAADILERTFAAATALGVRPLSARLGAGRLAGAKVAMSYTDGYSLSLGLGMSRGGAGPILMGGFHGLSDIEMRAPDSMRGIVRATIRRSLAGLDHAFFFGSADRDVAIARYGLSPALSSVIPFGVDAAFWRPMPGVASEDYVLAVGQDPSRDYDLLVRAPGAHPTRIITRRKLAIPACTAHVKVSAGDFYGSDSLSDEGLRALYCRAHAVVVPLKDVYQPTGYSVTLQAMACGRPVVLSRIKGLWTTTLLRDGENCLLVPPGDAQALGDAIGRLRADPALCARLGKAARETVLAHFDLDRIGSGTVALARLGLEIWRTRAASMSTVPGETIRREA